MRNPVDDDHELRSDHFMGQDRLDSADRESNIDPLARLQRYIALETISLESFWDSTQTAVSAE